MKLIWLLFVNFVKANTQQKFLFKQNPVGKCKTKATSMDVFLLSLSEEYLEPSRTFDDKLFCGMVYRQKAFRLYFQPKPLPEILTIANLRHAASRIRTCAEPEFSICWVKLCSSDNYYSTAPLMESFCKKSSVLLAVNYFCKISPS